MERSLLYRDAIIRKCKSGDSESGKPWCLYSHEGELLGRHPNEASARKQECAIKAKGGSKRLAKITNYLFLFE